MPLDVLINMNYLTYIILICGILQLSSCNTDNGEKKEEPHPPNILLIMADDLGYSDIGCFGGEIATPNIDALAQQGIRLTQCYNNGICAPSRASLLTGQYPHQTGIGFFNIDLKEKGYEGYLSKETPTFGEVFQQAGYETFMTGKWHVGNDSIHQPIERGFDRFFGFLDGASSYFDDQPIMKVIHNASFYEGRNKAKLPEDFYATDFITDKGIKFLSDRNPTAPFLLYMAYNAPHWPLHAKDEDVAKYKGRYDMGWDSLRTQRFDRQAALGVADRQSPQASDSSFPAWNTLSEEQQASWAKKMEIYAAMVDNLDQNIGRLIQYLKEQQQLDNTLILFVSDNGADNWDIKKMPVFVPSKGELGKPGSNESYGRPWASVSNSPLREYKSKPYEGGISSPFIARYPKLIPAGTTKKGFIHFVDFLPTLLAVTEVPFPQQVNDTDAKPLPGESFLPLLTGKDWQRQTPIYYEWGGNRAIRAANWKLVSKYPAKKWELFDIDTDRAEAINLASVHPEIVERLQAQYDKWAEVTGVVPWGPEMQKRTGFKPSS